MRAATAWPRPIDHAPPVNLGLIGDPVRPAPFALAVTHSVLLANPRLDPFAALVLATSAQLAAQRAGIDRGFFAATLLQESAFDPAAISAAGAVGIAQFTLDTAAVYGVSPFDWQSAMRGSAGLLAAYLHAYRGRYPDPYAIALAAYNAGPGAVAHYRGVPPYPETRAYIADIYDRWSRIRADERPPPGPRNPSLGFGS